MAKKRRSHIGAEVRGYRHRRIREYHVALDARNPDERDKHLDVAIAYTNLALRAAVPGRKRRGGGLAAGPEAPAVDYEAKNREYEALGSAAVGGVISPEQEAALAEDWATMFPEAYRPASPA